MKRRKLLFIIPLLLGAFNLVGCSFISNLQSYINQSNTVAVYPLSLSFEEKSTNLSLNNTKQLKCVIKPESANSVQLDWKSSNPDVVSVNNNGFIKALAQGNTTITASYKESLTASLEVVVDYKEITGLKFAKKEFLVKEGSSSQLVVDTEPIDASDRDFTFESSDPSIVSVSKTGIVTATKDAIEGDQVTITVTSDFKPLLTAQTKVRVISKSENKVRMNKNYKDFEKKSIYRGSYCPSEGNVNLLVIPVWFQDSKNATGIDNKEEVRKDIEKVYFGNEEEAVWQSVKTYYEKESTIDGENILNINGVVSEWYECADPVSKYSTDEDATRNLVEKATNWYFSNTQSDSRRNYDSDGDGYLDGVVLIYAAADYNTDNRQNTNLWAYCAFVNSNANVVSPTPNNFFWASYDFMYGSSNRIGRHSGGFVSEGYRLDSHTYIHEMGHMFGLVDYYDYSNQYSPAGGFSMQDLNIGGHDPFSSIALGWAEPYIPKTEGSITLRPFESSHDVILLSPNLNSGLSPFDEYLLLEYYTPTGLNELDSKKAYQGNHPIGPSQSGIRVWHVDARIVEAQASQGKLKTDASSLTNDFNKYSRIALAFSNTYFSSDEYNNESYASPLGKNYSNYNLLQLIRKNDTKGVFTINKIDPRKSEYFSNDDLFIQGDSFSLSDYPKQFVNGKNGKLNNNQYLDYTFNVKSISNDKAVIEIINA